MRFVLIAALAVVIHPALAAAQTLARPQFTSPGWATFGLALPTGAAASGVQVGTLPTQVDVKNRWSDGSIRFAVVTAKVPSGGTYAVTTKSPASGVFAPTWPTVRVTFAIGGVNYVADLPPFNATNSWLSGPLVRESRVIVVPASSSQAHPLLQAVFDVRSYSDGTHRVDVTVQNVRDVAAMDKVTYDVTMTVNGLPMYSKQALTQYSFTRWHKTLYAGLTEAVTLPDFEPFYQSAALPRFLSTVINANYDTSSAAWDIMGFGSMNPNMGSGAYRPELSPYPAWQAQYIVHKSAAQRDAMMKNANNSGSWSMHITKDDGVSLIKVTDSGFESYWFDYFKRNGTGPGPLVPLRPDGNMRGIRKGAAAGYSDIESLPDPEHLPNLTYLPYLVTGDRYFLDQTKLWAQWSIINLTPRQPVYPEPTVEPGLDRSRRGNKGLIWSRGLTRELGHPLTVMAMAGVAIPDADSDKGYFIGLVQNQLDALGEYAALSAKGGISEAVGWETWNTQDTAGLTNGRYMSLWRLSYTVYAVDFAAQQKLWSSGGSADFVRRVVRSQIGFIVNGATGGEKIPNYPVVALNSSTGTLSFFTSWSQLFDVNRNASFGNSTKPTGWSNFAGVSPVGYHGVEAHLVLQAGRRFGVSGADAAAQWLLSYKDSYGTILGDLGVRSGYGLAASTAAGPDAPTNVRVR